MSATLIPFTPSKTSQQFHEATGDKVWWAYSGLLEESGVLIDVAMHTATAEEAANIVCLAEAMAERLGVVKALALTRLDTLQKGN